MSTFKQDHDALQARVGKQQQETSDEHALYQLFEKHRELANVEANRQILLTYFNSDPMDLATLEEALVSPALRKQLCFISSAEDRAKSLETIERITGSIPVTAQYSSDAELAAKAAELERRRELSKKNPDELRTLIANARPAPEPDDLPAHMDRAFLLGLTAPGTFKKVVERYGSKAVTERLNKR